MALSEIPEHVPGDTEKRMLLLYAVKKLGRVGNMQLIAFMLENGLMNYFDLQDLLHKLTEGGLLQKTAMPADILYAVTEEGEAALRLFGARTAKSLLNTVDEKAPGARERFRTERELYTRVCHEGGSEYHALMQINEMHRPVFSVDVALPTAEMTKRYCVNWPSKAQKIYDYIIKTLSEEDDT